MVLNKNNDNNMEIGQVSEDGKVRCACVMGKHVWIGVVLSVSLYRMVVFMKSRMTYNSA